MKKILEGSRAVALTVRSCRPGVICAYPITPQTHIVEDLAKFKADGEAKYEYIRAESEFAAASVVEGASATGVRSYTATCSQGILLMTEVLFNIAGMRLPVVLTCANRAVSAPISIWNDHQDVVTVRDSGWLMLFGETIQDIVDQHVIAFRWAEEMGLPVMVNMDGFILTHVYEPVDLPPSAKINKFLPKYEPKKGTYLDPDNPMSFGAFATPAHYQGIRENLHDDTLKSKRVLIKLCRQFKEVFGREVSPLYEDYKMKDADTVMVAMGSVCGTVKEAIDELREKGKKVGLFKLKCYRPFPAEEIAKALGRKKRIIVLDKSISLGNESILLSEIKSALYGKSEAKIQSYVTGLGGWDVRKEVVKKVFTSREESGPFVY